MLNFNEIVQILKLADESVEVTQLEDDGLKLIAYVQKKNGIPTFCEQCGSRMESKGPRYRLIKHQIIQDGRELYLKVKTRKWHCSSCGAYRYDTFNFAPKFKQTSNLTDVMLLDMMKDLNLTARQIARRLNVSDTYVHETFMRYVDLPRLPLCRVLCIDEVYLRFDKVNRFSVVLMNWETGEIIDILPNRFRETLRRYFNKIPKEERDIVEYVVSDMWDTYSRLAGRDGVFVNAASVYDTFHHTQPIIDRIQTYINGVKKEYQIRDRKKLEEENYRNNRSYKTRKDSREVTLLKRYAYFLLKNHDDIDYTPYYRYIKNRGGYWFYPELVEREFMALDKNFPIIREQKEMYIKFTHSYVNDPEGAAEQLDKLIAFYKQSELRMFREFASILEDHKAGIITSFTFLQAERSTEIDTVLRRISNGPLESFNNIPKDYKRQSNGVRNFSYTRNRILWAVRKNPAMRAVPYAKEDVHTKGRKRGSYNK